MSRVDERLSRVVVWLARNLLQYINECYPWAEDEQNEQKVLKEIVARQNESIAKLVALLDAREVPVDFGVYPDYTDYNYVALDRVLDDLVTAEKRLIDELKRAEQECQADPEAAALLREVWETEAENLRRLEQLVASRVADQGEATETGPISDEAAAAKES